MPLAQEGKGYLEGNVDKSQNLGGLAVGTVYVVLHDAVILP